MKHIVFYLFLFATIFSSCSMRTTIVKDSLNESTEEYSIKTNESFIDSPSASNYMMIEAFNDRMGVIVDSLIFTTKSNATEFFARLEGERPIWKYELKTKDTIYMAKSGLISGRIESYVFTGGSHGVTKFYAVNFIPEEGRFISRYDILDYSKSDKIDAIIKKYFDKKSFTVTPTLDLATIVNVSNNAVIFTYEHYVLGSYSSGVATIEVPKKAIQQYLKIK